MPPPSPLAAVLLTMAIGASPALAQGQKKTTTTPQVPTTTRQNPAVNCSVRESAKSCASFKQLLDAHDKQILAAISSDISYVCFRPDEDAFFIFHYLVPQESYLWKEADDGGEVTRSKHPVTYTEFREGVQSSFRMGSDYWRRYAGEPQFYSEVTEGRLKGLQFYIDDTELSVVYPFENTNGTTTDYSLTIRRSTGRFTETFSTSKSQVTHSGSCLIYR